MRATFAMKSGLACAVISLGVLVYVYLASARFQLRRLVGVALPEDATEIKYYYKKIPDYQWVTLWFKCKVPKQSVEKFVGELGIVKVDSRSGFSLANGPLGPDPSLSWWNPPAPENQNERWARASVGDIVCIWNDGYLYFRKNGNVGNQRGPPDATKP